jgi:hypothetical protein
MENVPQTVVTNQLSLLDKKDRPSEENPSVPLNVNIDLGARNHVDRRIKQIFGMASHL